MRAAARTLSTLAAPSGAAPPAPTASAPIREFLAWVVRRPRTYAETMTAWRTSCPRYSVWEDALGDGLVRLDGGAPADQARVHLTPCGHTLLGG